MIDLPVAHALDLRRRPPERRGPRLRSIGRAAVAVRGFVAEWRRASSAKWITHFERPLGRPRQGR